MSRIYINDSWLFSESFKEKYIDGAVDKSMAQVRLPHTTRELPYNYFSEEEYQCVSAYRRVIFAPNEWRGKRVLITFEGAAHYAEASTPFVNTASPDSMQLPRMSTRRIVTLPRSSVPTA